MIVEIPLTDAPRWLSHLELSRDADRNLVLRIVKHSGSDYGAAVLSEKDLLKAMRLV
jgi:hypothetical protein